MWLWISRTRVIGGRVRRSQKGTYEFDRVAPNQEPSQAGRAHHATLTSHALLELVQQHVGREEDREEMALSLRPRLTLAKVDEGRRLARQRVG